MPDIEREASVAIGAIRASDGADSTATASLAALVAAERAVVGEPPRAAGPVEGLAIDALGEEVTAALAAGDPTGAIDTRLLTVGEGLVGLERLAVELQPHLVDLEIRDIGRGNLPSVAGTSVAMQAGEVGLFEAQAEILESVAVKGTKGGYAGTRVRVSNDVSVR